METGVEPTRMSVAGFGEYRPVADNDSAEGRNRNRRVVVVVMASEDTKVTASATSAATVDTAASMAIGGETPAASKVATLAGSPRSEEGRVGDRWGRTV